MEPTILIKVEEPTGDCQKCFYYSSDTDGGRECFGRPSDATQDDPCFEVDPAKNYIFLEQKN